MQSVSTVMGSDSAECDPSVNVVLDRRFRRAAAIALVFCGTCALLNMLGWMFDVPVLLHPLPDQPEMSSALAICILLSMLAAPAQVAASRAVRIVGVIFGLVVLAAGIANLICFRQDVGVDLGFVLWQSDSFGLRFPGPMFPHEAINCVAMGLAMALYNLQIRKWLPYQFLLLLVAVPNLMIVTGFAAGNQGVCAFFQCIKFSPVASTVLAVGAIAAFFFRPRRGFGKIFVSETSGGRLVRYMLPVPLVIVPPIALVQYGLVSGVYDDAIAQALRVIIIAGALVACIAAGARKVDRVEQEKKEVEAEKEIAEEQKAHFEQLLGDSIASYTMPRRSLKRVCLSCAHESKDASLELCPNDNSEMQLVAERLEEGTIFAEKYEVLTLLGAGGISSVYLAKQLHLDKLVALKLLHVHFATDAKYIQRFQREGRSMSKLKHDNIAAIYDFGISMDGEPYLIMDYLDGGSLADLVRLEGPLTWQAAVPIFSDICAGLQHAHANDVIHRDLKPANIMLVAHPSKGRIAKLVDFGLAKSQDASIQLTQTGDMVGSPAYMSPEQCHGTTIDERADIYGLGALMYDVLVGKPPIVGETVYQTLIMHVTEPPAPFPPDLDVPEWLKQIIFKALEKDKEDRQKNIDELLSELQAGVMRSLLPVSARREENKQASPSVESTD